MSIFSYLVTGAAAVILSWALAGCRFGNYVQNPPPPGDGISGYYDTRPQSLQFCVVTFNGSSVTTCKDANPVNTPDLIRGIITDPVALVATNFSQGEAVLVNYTTTGSTLPIYFDTGSQSLYFAGSGSPVTAYVDPACTSQLWVSEDGSYTRYGSPTTINGRSVSGAIQLKVDVVTEIRGTCGATGSAMLSCYQNPDSCGGLSGTDYNKVVSLFGDAIQAGAMTANDIQYATDVTYTVVYQ